MPETSEKIKAAKIPGFRRDLELYEGPDDPDGFPTFNLFDPVSVQFYKLNWGESLIFRLSFHGMTLQEIADAVNANSTITITPEEVMGFFEQASMLNLLNVPKSSDMMVAQRKHKKENPLMWLVMRYLYFRIPLLHPDNFLERTLPYVNALLFSRKAFTVYLVCTVVGILLMLNRFDEYIHTFTYFFTFEGFLIYGMATTAVKLVHEFAHAYTAKHYRVRVPTMGIAIMVLWPVLYTDVTDGWKLKKRKQRLAISAAGMVAELIVAGVCTLGWALSPPGVMQSTFFVLSSTTWIRSFIVNLNPSMRFDGYYLLCDLWGVDNLRSRAFAMFQWKMRQVLWGFNTPPPEEHLSKKLEHGMYLYTVCTWIYLIFLYTTIALFVYYEFTKALGILLFFAEVVIFMIWPFFYEFQMLYKLRTQFHINLRLIFTSLILSVIFCWLVIPLPHATYFHAITVPEDEQIVYIPREGIVEKIFVKQGDKIKKGQPIIKIFQKKLASEAATTQADLQLVRQELQIVTVDQKALQYVAEKKSELAETEERIKKDQAELAEMTVKSTLDGVVYEWDENLLVNQAVKQNESVGRIADMNHIAVICFIPENQMKNLQVGQQVSFIVAPPRRTYRGVVETISTSNENTLIYPTMSSQVGGPIPSKQYTRSDGGQDLKIVDSYFTARITLESNEPPLRYREIGAVVSQGAWRSYGWDFIEYAWSILLRESSL